MAHLNELCIAHGLLPVCAGAVGLADAYARTAAPPGPAGPGASAPGSTAPGSSSGTSDGAAGSALRCVAGACQAAGARHFAGEGAGVGAGAGAAAPAAAAGGVGTASAPPAVTVGSFVVCRPCPKRLRAG